MEHAPHQPEQPADARLVYDAETAEDMAREADPHMEKAVDARAAGEHKAADDHEFDATIAAERARLKSILEKDFPEAKPEKIEQMMALVGGERTYERLLDSDHLTGVANRRAWEKAQQTAEADDNVAVILFDANNFGQINKQFGHETGDEEIKQLAESIRAAADEYGMGERVFRVGGDEFVVLAPKDVAPDLIARAETLFGSRQHGDIKVSLTGTWGKTLSEADGGLQEAKSDRKKLDLENV